VVVSDANAQHLIPDIFALGECARAQKVNAYGLVAPLYEMGKVIAEQLTGNKAARLIWAL